MPRDHAERVVAGARALSPHLGDRMQAAQLLGKPVVVRELLPQDLKLEIDQFREARRSRRRATSPTSSAAPTGGRWTGRRRTAGARPCATIAAAGSTRRHGCGSGVVELMASHEKGYLDHCRRYALEDG